MAKQVRLRLFKISGVSGSMYSEAGAIALATGFLSGVLVEGVRLVVEDGGVVVLQNKIYPCETVRDTSDRKYGTLH